MTVPAISAACPNLILSRLPAEEYESLRPHLEFFPTPAKTVLFERDREIRHVYFPMWGVHSVLAIMENGAAIEVGTIGNEGFTTVDILTGSTVATETIVCQIPGESLRMAADRFREAMTAGSELRRLAYRFLQAYLSQVSQSVACNRLHTTEARFARWILISHDRVQGDEFELTHEYLADMLGVHRPSVSLIAQRFQQNGLIKYSRGSMTVLDRAGLEEVCCECYGAVRRRFARAIGQNIS